MNRGLPTNRQLGKLIEGAAADAGISIRRQRRWLAVSALVEIFSIAVSRAIIPSFVVKGGFALEMRFRKNARASRDVDVVVPMDPAALLDAAIEVLRIEWSGFTFGIKGQPERREHSFRFEVNALYRSAPWSTFDLELVFADVAGEDRIAAIDLGQYGLLEPSPIPCMTVAEQIAQKFHAVSDPQENRPRDLIDIFLLANRLAIDRSEVLDACRRTFEERGTHQWPPNIEVRGDWVEQLDAIIADSALEIDSAQVLSSVFQLLSKLTGITMADNFQYHFLVLQGLTPVPNEINDAIDLRNGSYATFKRMTEQEGWRLSQMMRYPSRDVTEAILVVLERPLPAQ